MNPNLGSTLIRAHLLLGKDPIDALRETEKILLANHITEMETIDKHYKELHKIYKVNKND